MSASNFASTLRSAVASAAQLAALSPAALPSAGAAHVPLATNAPPAIPRTDSLATVRRVLPRSANDDAIRAQVQLIVLHGQAQLHFPERRANHRHPFPYPIVMTPVLEDDQPDDARSFVVIGKHLSEGGLDFYHRQPLTERRLIASFSCGRANSGGQDRRVGLLLDLTWCRFSRLGWYEQGGKFIAPAAASSLEV